MKQFKWITVVLIGMLAAIFLADSSYAVRNYDQNLGRYQYYDIWLDEPRGFIADQLYELRLVDGDLIVTFSRYRLDDSSYRYEDVQPGNYQFNFTKENMNRKNSTRTEFTYDNGYITFTINDDGHFENVQARELEPGTSVSRTNTSIRYRGNFEYYDNFFCRLGGCSPRWYLSVYFSLHYQSQSPPILDIISDQGVNVYANYEGYNLIHVEGYVQDADNDPVTVTVTIDGVEKSRIVHNTSVARLFSIPFDVIADGISGGEHTVTITADDSYYNGRITKTYDIKVSSIVGANRYVLVGTPLLYFTEYSDYENDPIHSQQFRYVHDERYFEHSLGQIPDSGVWRSRYETLTRPGHYQIEFRNRDNPKDDDRFDEFRRWSPASPVLDLYVHRKPIASFDVYLERDQHNHNDLKLDVESTSYDLDHRSKPGAGIVEERWSWKLQSDADWTEGRPPESIYRHDTYEVRLTVKDLEGEWSDPAIRVINPGGIYLPIAGFAVQPKELYKNQPTTITSTARHERANEPITHQYYIQKNGQSEVAHTTDPNWTISFPEAGTYTIRQVVTDRNGYSAQHTETVTVTNRLPTVNVMSPASDSAARPSQYDYADPVVIRWTYTDADSDPQARYQLQVIRQSNAAIVFDSGQVNSADKQRQVHDLPRGETLRVQVRAHDGYNWSSWSPAKYLYIIDNQPPVADFTWSPATIWEGDTVNITNRSTDPDGDPLSYAWAIKYPDGSMHHYTSEYLQLKLIQAGAYDVRLTVSDGRLSAEKSSTLQVLPLTLTADVHHTEQWLDYHQEAGHETETNPKDFYSGEKFMLSAVTSPAPVRSVTASLDTVGKDDEKLSLHAVLELFQPTRYAGDMYDQRLSSLTAGLPQGEHTIRFHVQYMNGTVKTADVPIRIIGHVLDTAGVHRMR